MKNKGDIETAKILSEIRDQALAKSKMPIGPDLPWEYAISRLVPKDKSSSPVIMKSKEVLK